MESMRRIGRLLRWPFWIFIGVFFLLLWLQGHVNTPLQAWMYPVCAIIFVCGLTILVLRFIRLVKGEGLRKSSGSESVLIIKSFGPYMVGAMLSLFCCFFTAINHSGARNKLFLRAVTEAAESETVIKRIGEYQTHGIVWSSSSYSSSTYVDGKPKQTYARGIYSCRLIGTRGAVNATFEISCENSEPCEFNLLQLE